uniref:MFS transporter n=1 Tax=Azohydromonas lata TaxID=45677 RepID=UPI000A015113
VWGLAQPFTGMVADRYGSRRMVVAGLLCYAAGLLLMSLAPTPAAFTLSAGLCIGMALSGTAFGTVYGALNRLVVPQQRSWAQGMAGAVGGLGQFLVLPLSQGLIAQLGWAGALAALSLLCALLLPCAKPLNDHPATAGPGQQRLSSALREAFGHRGFWLLNLGFLACGFQLAFIAAHLPAYVLDRGLSARHAVAGLALVALANVAGTYVLGGLGGRYRRKHLLAGVYLARSLAMAAFVLLPLSPWSLYAFCAVMGFLWLGTVPLTNGLVLQVFGVQYIATLFGFVFFGHQLGAFLGVWLGAAVFDATRSYDVIWLAGIGLGLLAALLHWPIDDRPLVPATPAAA